MTDTKGLWLVEIDQGGNTWKTIAACISEKQAHELASAPHIAVGKPVRVRKEWEAPYIQIAGRFVRDR